MKNKMIKIIFSDSTYKDIEAGVSFEELTKDFKQKFKGKIVAVKVNNEIKELTKTVCEPASIEFIDTSTADGQRIYVRSLTFVLIKAVADLFPERKVVINYSISKGLYIEVKGGNDLTEGEVLKIEKRMREIIQENKPIEKKVVSLDKARQLFNLNGRMDRYDSLDFRDKPHVTFYNLDGLEDYFYGYMVPSTGYLDVFSVKFYKPGLILLYPEKNSPSKLKPFEPQDKLFSVFVEHKNWLRILGVSNVSDLNKTIKAGKIGDFIRVSEGLQEKKIASIADMICDNKHKKRVVLISGPSSSGKTTFAQRLAIQLRVNGVRPVTLSLDNYFLNREDTPRDEDGNYDFENIDAIDVSLFNKHLSELIAGEEVELPIFNFTEGKREKERKKMKIDSEEVLIIEGIHGLNEQLTSLVDKENKFKIYVSALTSLNIDEHNRISTTDTRLIRRIVRDFQFRGASASYTIKIWPSVRRGEEKNIFPFQEEADVMFNSALNYEISALRKKAEELLSEVQSTEPEYAEAKRVLEFIKNFLTIDDKDIPCNSIVREFLGGCCFN
jgi:uridine kinase